MKILFVARHVTYFRNFDSVLALLALVTLIVKSIVERRLERGAQADRAEAVGA